MKEDWKRRCEMRLPQSPFGLIAKNPNTFEKQQRQSVIVGPRSVQNTAETHVAPKSKKEPSSHFSVAGTKSQDSLIFAKTQNVDASEFFVI